MKIVATSIILVGGMIFTGCGSSSTPQVKAAYQVNPAVNQNSTAHYTYSASALSIPAISSAQKREFINAINTARSKPQNCGKYGYMAPAGNLKWNDRLYKAAYGHSYDMAKSGNFSHHGSGSKYDHAAKTMTLGRGSNPGERLKFHNYKWRAYAENIAAGQSSTNVVIDQWLKSDGHCKNLMDEKYTEVGMALYRTEDGKGYYWTQNFGKSL